MIVDKKTIINLKKGNRKAQYQLYKDCFGILMSICSRYENNKNDAASLLNIGFVKIVSSLDKYDVRKPFEPWIKRVMINTAIDEYRKKKNYRETMTSTDFSAIDYKMDKVDYNRADLELEANELRSMIHQLPEMSREVFNLFAIDGYKHREIAEMLKISEGTSKWHLANAREKLKTFIKQSMNTIKSIAL